MDHSSVSPSAINKDWITPSYHLFRYQKLGGWWCEDRWWVEGCQVQMSWDYFLSQSVIRIARCSITPIPVIITFWKQDISERSFWNLIYPFNNETKSHNQLCQTLVTALSPGSIAIPSWDAFQTKFQPAWFSKSVALNYICWVLSG